MKVKDKDDQRHRLNIRMDKAAKRRLDHVSRLAGHETTSETVRRALSVYASILETHDRGGEVWLDGERLILP